MQLPRKIQQNSYIINNNKQSHELWAVWPQCSAEEWNSYGFEMTQGWVNRKCENEGLQMERQREGPDGESRGVRRYVMLQGMKRQSAK